MSIIEKAVNRLGSIEKAALAQAGKVEVVGPAAGVEAPANDAPARDSAEASLRQELASGSRSLHGPTKAARSANYGSIDLEKLRAAGMITPDSKKSQLSEEFRIIKRPLLTNAFKPSGAAIKHGNLVMVTSALPGEGKSFTAINLAMSIAMEMDHTVLLVDADVAKPSLPAFLGVQGERGLMDLLLDDRLRFSDVLIKTNVPRLNILPAGQFNARATELLASDAMSRLLSEMAARYPDRLIIFDSPPLLATTESRVLASRMGQIVMIVEAAKTPREVVREALAQIDKCEVVGLLLNKGTGRLGDDQYGYSPYGYGYGV